MGVYECVGVCAGCMEGLGNGLMTPSDHLQGGSHGGLLFPVAPRAALLCRLCSAHRSHASFFQALWSLVLTCIA